MQPIQLILAIDAKAQELAYSDTKKIYPYFKKSYHDSFEGTTEQFNYYYKRYLLHVKLLTKNIIGK